MRRLFNTKIKQVISQVLALLIVAGCFTIISFASGSVEPIDMFEEYCIYTEYRANDGYIGIPVGICTYTKEKKADTNEKTTEMVFYVVNYNDNGENPSNEDDFAIISDLIDCGYLVVTLDYFDNRLACATDLVNSVQKIRTTTSSVSSIANGYAYNPDIRRVLPSGYRVTSNIEYFNFIENSPKGVKESTVFEAWNSANFENKYNAVKTDAMPEYQEYDSCDDLYMPDGSPIDWSLYLDVSYPSRPVTNEIPVICWASSGFDTTSNHTVSKRPHDSAALFRGYAFVAYDHCFYPMAKTENYGSFDPFGMQYYLGIHTHTAAIRCVRYYSYLFGYGTDSYGGFGHSKSALIASLANPHPELLHEESTFPKSYTWNGKVYDASYYRDEMYGDHPYLAYKDSDEVIPSNLQFCYSSMGLGAELHSRNHNASTAPMFTASGISDQYKQWEFWAEQLDTYNQSGSTYMALSFLDKGHEYVYGTNAIYGFDELLLVFDYMDYFLKDNISPRVGYFTTDGLAEVTTDSGVSVQFTGSISEDSIYNGVVLTDTTDNKRVDFNVTSVGNGSKWIFYAKDGYIAGHSYKLEIGETVVGSNGMKIKSAESAVFECTNVPKVVACSADLFNNSIKYFSAVAVQFSAPIDYASLVGNTTVLKKVTTEIENKNTGKIDIDTVEEVVLPTFEMIGDNTLWTIAGSSHPKNKWNASQTNDNGTTKTTETYEYIITIGANVCATNGESMGEDCVIKFTTKK